MRIFTLLLFFFFPFYVYTQNPTSIDGNRLKLDSISANYEIGNYELALEGCVDLINQEYVNIKDKFQAAYYASAISIYNGNPDYAEIFMVRAQSYLRADSFTCDQTAMYRLLRAEYDLESGRFLEASNQLKDISINLEGCTLKRSMIARVNYYRAKAFISYTQEEKSPDSLTISINGLNQILNMLSKNDTLLEYRRIEMYTNLYLAEAYWMQAWLTYSKALKNTEQNNRIAEYANIALEKLDALEFLLKEFPEKRIEFLLKILKAQILGHIRPLDEPIVSPIISDSSPYDYEQAIRLLLECTSNDEFKIFKEYSYARHIKRQMIIMYWQYFNEVENNGEYSSFDDIIKVFKGKNITISFRDIYGYLPEESLLSYPTIGYPGKDAFKNDEKKDEVDDRETKINAGYSLLIGVSILLFIPFLIVFYLGYKYLERYSHLRGKDAEIERLLQLIEDINEDQNESSKELGGKNRTIKDFIHEVARKEEDIKHLKMELSHRLINNLLHLSGTIKDDKSERSISRDELADNAITRIRSAIKLQRLLETYDNRSSIYFPTYFNALQQDIKDAFAINIQLECAEVGTERRVPHDFARDIGQLILEWLFLLAKVPVNHIRVFAEPTNDSLYLSVEIAEQDWEKMGAPTDFSALEQKNSQIAPKIGFYLKKYQHDEGALLHIKHNYSQVSLYAILKIF